MGNAMDFLNDRKEKKEVNTENTILTKCEDATITLYTNPHLIQSVNHKEIYGTDIKGLGARRKDKRKSRKCKCCTDEFKPNTYLAYGGIKKYTLYCEKCDGTIHVSKRQAVKELGGWEKYTKYHETYIPINKLSVKTSLSVLEEQLALRIEYGKATKSIQKKIDARTKQYKLDDKPKPKYDFDF